MKVEYRKLSEIRPYERNPRHNDQAVDAVVKSLEEFGFRQPVVIDRQGVIVVGHTRYKAAERLGWEEIPCHVADLTPEQAKGYRLADNQTATLAEWDKELLPLELSDLQAADFDLDLLGFSDAELNSYLPSNSLDEIAINRVEDVQDKWSVERSQVWQLGRHLLLCGDSTVRSEVNRLMGDSVADIVFTSPPYLQQRDYTKASDTTDWDALMMGVFANLPAHDKTQVLVNLGLIHRDGEWIPYWDNWIQWMRDQGWRRFGWYVWDQQSGLPGDWNGRFAPSHEFVFHFNARAIKAAKTKATKTKATKTKATIGFRKEGGSKLAYSPDKLGQPFKILDSVIRINRCSPDGRYHPATFPVAFASEIVAAWPGDVYDPFLGAGATMVAAEQLGRRCYAIEIEPKYVAISIERMSQLGCDCRLVS